MKYPYGIVEVSTEVESGSSGSTGATGETGATGQSVMAAKATVKSK